MALQHNRGRPSTFNRAQVASTAIRLWRSHGFASVTWADIAAAAEVNPRTLARHFSAKEELAWVGVDQATDYLRHSLDNSGDFLPTSDAICTGILASLEVAVEHSDIQQDWLTVLVTEPELQSSSIHGFSPWVATIADFIVHRHPDINPAAAKGIATAYQVTAFEELVRHHSTAEGLSGREAAHTAGASIREALQWINFTVQEFDYPTPPSHST